MQKYKVLIVDDSMMDLSIAESILKPHYDVWTASSVPKMYKLLEKIVPDLFILDITMPAMDGYDTIKMLQSTDKYQRIPVIFITGDKRAETRIRGLELGAVDVLHKPLDAEMLLKYIHIRLLLYKRLNELYRLNEDMKISVVEKTDMILNLQTAILSIVAGLVEFRDVDTGKHIIRTQEYLHIFINKLLKLNVYRSEMKDWVYDYIILSAQLHDIGKIAISDTILNKPGKLDQEEFERIKEHVNIGINIIDHMIEMTGEHIFLKQAKQFVQYHHEKWDGSGYPVGLKGLDIPLEGRLLAIIDVYDALISKRPYKEPFTHEKAVEIINTDSGTHFDPDLVNIFNMIEKDIKKISSMDVSSIPYVSGFSIPEEKVKKNEEEPKSMVVEIPQEKIETFDEFYDNVTKDS